MTRGSLMLVVRADVVWLQQLTSPEFQNALGSLTSALQTNNFNTVFANFGLDPMDGAEQMARGDGVGAFVRALEARARRNSECSVQCCAATVCATRRSPNR